MNDRASVAVFVTLAAAGAAWWWVRMRPASSGGGGTFFSTLTGATDEQKTQTPAPAQQEGAVSQTQPPSLMQRVASWVTPLKGQVYDGVFRLAEAAYSLPAGLLSRVAWQESRYDPNARSGKGAVGLMQFTAPTAQDFNIDPLDPSQSIWAAGKYLRQLYNRFGDWRQALAAYNWGPGNVATHGLDQAPAETQQYYTSIVNDLGLT